MSTFGGWGGWGLSGGAEGPMLPEALTRSRAALTGPFKGATLPLALPPQLDNPSDIQRWEATPRLQICELEAMSGLLFNVNQAAASVTLEFVDVSARPLSPTGLVTLARPTADIFRRQVDLVANYAELRADRASEILAQATPSQVPFWAPIIGMQPRDRWTQELVALALSMTVAVEMRLKHAFACPRPVTLSPQLQPMIQTPGHGSWPSGHATESYLVATLLRLLLQSANGNGEAYREQLERLAARVAVNRTVAGLHYPVDSAVGRLLGTALAEFFAARCGITTGLHARGFTGPGFVGASGAPLDFDPRVSMDDNRSGYYQFGAALAAPPVSSLLAFVWEKARQEWQGAR